MRVFNFCIQERIEALESEFDLILFSEFYEESMVLLAEKLCWPLDFVKSLKLNARKPSYKVDLKSEERQSLEAWQHGDVLLYNHFKRIFDKKVRKFFTCTLYVEELLIFC